MSPLVKALGIGIGTFALAILVFWAIAAATGRSLISLPQRPVSAVKQQATPTPTPPTFLRY